MFLAVLRKDALLLGRDGVWRRVCLVYLVLFMFFTMSTASDLLRAREDTGVPQRFWVRLMSGQWACLTVLVPWVVSRYVGLSSLHERTRLLMQAALPPWQALGSMGLISALYLALLVLLPLPLLQLAAAMGDVTVSAMLWAYLDLLLWLACLQSCTFAWHAWLARAALAAAVSYTAAASLSVAALSLTGLLSVAAMRYVLLACLAGFWGYAYAGWSRQTPYLQE